jgi:hypothetical protein
MRFLSCYNKQDRQCSVTFAVRFTTPLLSQHFTQRALLWRFNVAGNNKTYFALNAKGSMFLLNFNQIWNFSTDFREVPNIKFHVNRTNGADTCRQTN